MYIPVKDHSTQLSVYVYDKLSSNFHERIEFDCDPSGSLEAIGIKIDSESNIIVGIKNNNYDGYVLKYNQNENSCYSLGKVDTTIRRFNSINDQIVTLWDYHKIITLDSELMEESVRDFKFVDAPQFTSTISGMWVVDDELLISLNHEYGSISSEELLF